MGRGQQKSELIALRFATSGSIAARYRRRTLSPLEPANCIWTTGSSPLSLRGLGVFRTQNDHRDWQEGTRAGDLISGSLRSGFSHQHPIRVNAAATQIMAP